MADKGQFIRGRERVIADPDTHIHLNHFLAFFYITHFIRSLRIYFPFVRPYSEKQGGLVFKYTPLLQPKKIRHTDQLTPFFLSVITLLGVWAGVMMVVFMGSCFFIFTCVYLAV